jgi:hypothetical protein
MAQAPDAPGQTIVTDGAATRSERVHDGLMAVWLAQRSRLEPGAAGPDAPSRSLSAISSCIRIGNARRRSLRPTWRPRRSKFAASKQDEAFKRRFIPRRHCRLFSLIVHEATDIDIASEHSCRLLGGQPSMNCSAIPHAICAISSADASYEGHRGRAVVPM